MVKEYKNGHLLSWEEIDKVMKVKGIANVESQVLPGLGHFVTLTGTAKGIAKAKRVLSIK